MKVSWSTLAPRQRQTHFAQPAKTGNQLSCLIGRNEGQVGIAEERVVLKRAGRRVERALPLFPAEISAPNTIMSGRGRAGQGAVLSKSGGSDHYYTEVGKKAGKGWFPTIRLGPRKSTLANLHEDETRFPVSIWLKRLLVEGVQTFVLNSRTIRESSPPGQVRSFKTDGSNLPWVVEDLRGRAPDRLSAWVEHVGTVLPDVTGITVGELPDVRRRYLKVSYRDGVEVPSWMVSDGTLRLLALTLPAYLPDFRGLYLIEEPENGIHPLAVEAVFQSLSSTYDAQILMATHSPVILSMADPRTILCFNKTTTGATDIVLGSDHPRLKDWKGEPNLSILFAAGVLG